MTTDRIRKWREILLDPCNLSAQRRNTATIRQSFEEINNYFITNITEVTGGDPNDEIVFFEVQANDLGDPGNDGVAVKALDLTTFDPTGADYTLFDYTPQKRFAKNFVDGYYGVGKKAPEIQEDALVVIELEGRARWIDGTLDEDMGATTPWEVRVNVDNFWGAYPNIHDPGAQVIVHDRNKLGYNAVVGNRYMAVWDEQDQVYVLVSVEDEELVFFRVKDSTNQGDQSCIVEELEFIETGGVLTTQVTGREFTLWDPTPHLRFSMNFVEHYFGCGRHTPELADDALICVELEGLARYIDGTLAGDMSGGTALANVDHFWGAFPNFQDPGAQVTVHDRNNFAENAKSGDRYIAIWDEQEQVYVLIIPGRECPCGFSGEMEYVMVCECEANSCCLWSAVIKRPDPYRTTDFCVPDWCYVPIWLWDYQGVSAGDPFPLSPCNATNKWCGFAKLVKRGHDCNGIIRDVYAFYRDNICECPCPGKTLDVTIEAFDCIEEDIVFEATCVTKNPMVDTAGSGWWGEFEIEGEYPMIGLGLSIEPFSTPDGDVTHIYVVLGCNNTSYSATEDYCRIQRAFYMRSEANAMLPDEFVEVFGSFTAIQPPVWDPAPTPIVDEFDCQMFCSRPAKYGMFIQCVGGKIIGAVVYHLFPEGSINRIEDDCAGLMVPSEHEFFNDQNSLTMINQSDCCEFNAVGETDTIFGNSDAIEGGGVLCPAPVVEQESSGTLTKQFNPVQYHVLGGCRDTIAQLHGATFPSICGDTAGTAVATVHFSWGGQPACTDL